MLDVCITFDYELFLGENNAPYSRILFEPTEQIITTLHDLGARGTFFADVCSVSAHRRLGDEAYAAAFEEQLRRMIRLGQDVQLHLHTNWQYARREGEKILPGSEGYRIHSLGFSESPGSARSVIREGKAFLERVCREADADYRCVAYRAGGFSVQPETELFRALLENGIVIDSSVVPHMRADTINQYDFTAMPDLPGWWVDPEAGLSHSAARSGGTMLEIPIATARPRLLQAAVHQKSERSLPAHEILGTYVKALVPPKPRPFLSRQWHRLFDYRYVSLDTRCYARVMEDLAYLHRHWRLDRADGAVCLICHPKLADESRVENIARLVAALQREPERYRISTFTDLYHNYFR